ncbi:hypothetical protein OIU79_025343 [Salix purpurea]|uniref:Uncharacterized protein n=1 Tax=Salix purpurea TaxID=77065 RepID=A0A9Q0W4Z0_SALPP|nr:hypothetical protein OIU79_025343 [Salix purpurea]
MDSNLITALRTKVLAKEVIKLINNGNYQEPMRLASCAPLTNKEKSSSIQVYFPEEIEETGPYSEVRTLNYAKSESIARKSAIHSIQRPIQPHELTVLI